MKNKLKFKNEIKLLEEFHYNKAWETLNLVLVTPVNHRNELGEPRIFVIWQKDSYYTVYDSLCSFHYSDGIGRLYDDADDYYKSGNRDGLKRDGYQKCIEFLEKYDTTIKPREKADADVQTEDNIINVTVEGGVIQNIVNIPDHVTVRIRDYDSDGTKKDQDGNRYFEADWKGRD